MTASVIRSQLIPLALDHLRRKGAPAPPLDGVTFSGDAAHVELTRLHSFLASCAEASDDPWLGLHLAIDRPVGSHGLLEFFWRSSKTVRDALMALASFSGLVNDLTRIELTEGPKTSWIRQIVAGHPDAMGRHGNEFFCAVVVNESHALVNAKMGPRRVAFAHAAPAIDLAPLERALGTTSLAWSQAFTGVEFDSSWLDAEVKTREPQLLGTLKAHAQTWIPHVVTDAPVAFAVRARSLLMARSDIPSMHDFARALGISERTLQRKLESEQTSFQNLLDDVRIERAESLLKGEGSVKEIAGLLGFSTTQAFVRAFRRWRNVTPTEWRESRAEWRAKSVKR